MTDVYDLTGQWLDRAGPTTREVELAAMLHERLGEPSRILELGAGFGGFAVAAARRGHRVVALERSGVRAERATHQLARAAGRIAALVTVVQDDFLRTDIAGPFDAVVCWNVFGCGPPTMDLPLLRRIRGWLGPGRTGYLDVFDPCWWDGIRQLAVSPSGLRKLVTSQAGSGKFQTVYWTREDPAGRVSEAVRCHSRSQVGALAARAGLVWRCGRTDERRGTYLLEVSHRAETGPG